MKFTIYFEVYGKKMKTVVEHSTEEGAREIVRQKIVFHKIEKEETKKPNLTSMFEELFKGKDNPFGNFEDIFGKFGNKK